MQNILEEVGRRCSYDSESVARGCAADQASDGACFVVDIIVGDGVG